MSKSREYAIVHAMPKQSDDDPRTQAEKFADLARELECDEDEDAFDERLRRLAPKAKPERPPEDRGE
jgi:hypothetical protein